MNIELKNLKHYAGMSHETNAFQATIYVDGKRAGDASNDGHGGMTIIHPQFLAKALDAYGATQPPVNLGDPGGEPIMHTQDGEWIIDRLVTRELRARSLKRMLSASVLFTKHAAAGVFTLKPKGKLAPARFGEFVARMSTPEAVARYGIKTILNAMPLGDAVDIAVAEGAI